MEPKKRNSIIIYTIALALCFAPFMSPLLALALGLGLSFTGIPRPKFAKNVSVILQAAIVMMGFGMDFNQVLGAATSGFAETLVSVLAVMFLGYFLTKFLKIDKTIGLLISAGTAICGGSAIAAVAPVSGAKDSQISFALAVVFILNAVALIVFPPLGHAFGLSQHEFGNWAAIAIHDTSSVVGAGATYGAEALQVATAVKLVRALWIIPLTGALAFFRKGNSDGKGVKIPWFILMFAGAIVFAWLFPQGWAVYDSLYWIGKKGMACAILLIGAGISVKAVKEVGPKSFLLGIALWVLIGSGSLVGILLCR
ncbi:UPF0324 membrane protein (plasmid) [Fulvitalea axinellae]|uniref:UPF0324 membrane protein n=1 Tax=Fulvitalea axinellae TaxID=1182444 RepID=A0AAU9CUD2_9BACT|nr:UPF0324 membrane protein [Fulvitalea axinellae]